MEASRATKVVVFAKGAAASTLSAVLLVLAFPPFNWPAFAWIALVPLFLLLYRCKILAGYGAGLLTGLLFYIALMQWTASLGEINLLNFLLLGIVLASFFGLFAGTSCWLLCYLPRWAPLILPVLWVSIEYLRSHIGFLSQPFGIIAYSQYTILPVAGLAAYTGIFGVSFLVVAGNAMLTTLIRHYVFPFARDPSPKPLNYKPLLPVFSVASLLFLWLIISVSIGDTAPPKQNLSVVIIQGNIHSDTKYDYQRFLHEVLPTYEQLTMKAPEAALVIWPSSTVPGALPADRGIATRLGTLAKNRESFLLVGAAGLDKFNPEQMREKRFANSAFLFSPSGRLSGRYDKIRLLPFDEYLPARNVIPWPAWMINQGMTDRYPGKQLTIFKAGLARFGVQICYENMFPDQTRQLARNGADFVVGQTNEAYTGSLAARYQNLAYSVFRAIENRMPILRSATTGVSCIIDATGQIIDSVKDTTGREVGVAGVVIGNIALGTERSFYTRFGDVFSYVCLAAAIALISLGMFIQIRRVFITKQRNSGG